MATTAIMDFDIREIYRLTKSGAPRRIIVPNFIKIGQSVADVLQFFVFFFRSRWRPPAILDLFGHFGRLT